MRAARVPFDVDDLAVDGVDERGAPDRAEGTDAWCHGGVLDAQLLRAGDDRRQVDA
jgi:hypothetical protein